MPDKKDLKLEKYGVSKYRYRELYNFCLQYEEKKVRRRRLFNNAVSEAPLYSGGRCHPGEADSLMTQAYLRLSEDISLIEDTAFDVDRVIAPFILKNVTLGVPFEYLGLVPCSRGEFYALRRNFFLLLDSRRP